VDDNLQLVDVAIRIADGASIDWASVESSATPEEAEVLDYLRALERLAQVHASAATNTGAGFESLIHGASRIVDETPAPVTWGPLTIIEKVGRGTYGDVYRARDPKLDRPVALKLLRRREKGGDALESAVIEEGRLMARVRHPNVVTVYGAERIEGRVGLWMEFVGAGRTLEDELRARGRFTAADVIAVGRDLAAALSAVHRAGLRHRDVKAQNAIRDTEGRIVLTDFGAGHEVDEAVNGIEDHGLAGTPLYLAPEVLKGGPASTASDLYSLGVLLFHIATASFPVRGRTLDEIRRAHQSGQRRRLAEERPDLPSWLARVIDTLIEPNPQARFTTAADVESALATSGTPVRVQPSIAQRLRHDWRLMAAAVALVVLATVLAAGAWRARSESRVASAPTPWAPLNAGDWIVVADFDNQTGEEVFDGTIGAAVRRELEYSNFVHVAQRARVGDALQSIDRPVDARLDRQMARDVSLRDGGVRAFVVGSIAKTGNEYDVVSEVVDPRSGATVATLTDLAPRGSEVLATVRRQTLRLRGVLGEPGGAIDPSRQDLERASIPSVKALHLYAQAQMTMESTSSTSNASIDGLLSVERILRDAVEDDPSFAAAALQLALVNRRILQSQRGLGPLNVQTDRLADILRFTERAFQLADTATPLERLKITGHFRHARTGTPEDLEKVAQAASAWEALSALQPDDELVMSLLQNCYRVLGRARDAASLDLRLADARPRNVDVNLGVAGHLLSEGNFDGARRYALRAEAALSPASDPARMAQVRLFPAYVAWLQDEPNTMLRALDEIASTAEQLPEAQRRFVRMLIWPLYAVLGRFRQAEPFVEILRPGDIGDVASAFRDELSTANYLQQVGDTTRLRESVSRWRDPLPDDLAPGFAEARVAPLIALGRLDAAQRHVEWFNVQSMRWYGISDPFGLVYTGAIELARGHSDAAIALLRRAVPIMRQFDRDYAHQSFSGQGAGGLSNIGQYATPILAQALEATGRVSEAIAILEESGRNRALVAMANMSGFYAPLNRWMRNRAQLARLYRKNGQLREAEAVEAHLLKLLALADPDYALIKELNARQSKLVVVSRQVVEVGSHHP
jgi:serine/threonine-protein kinase